MANDTELKVRISADNSGLADGLNEAKSEVVNATDSIGNSISNMTISALKATGVIFGLSEALSQIKSSLSVAADFEAMQIGIAAVIGASSENVDSLGNSMTATQKFALSQQEASKTMQDLRKANLETIATLPELTGAFQSVLAPSRSAGLSIQDTVKFTKDMANAAAAIGMPMNQLSQELRAVLEGDMSKNSRVNQILQITPAIIEAHKAAGDLSEYLNKRLQDYAVSGEAIAHSWKGISSNIQDAILSIKSIAANNIFEDMKKDGMDIQTYLTENAKKIGEMFGYAFRDIYIFAKQAFELVSNTVKTFVDTTNGLIKVFTSFFTNSFKTIDENVRSLNLFDYFMLGLITITEGVRQLVDAFKLGFVALGDIFHHMWEGIYAGYAWVIDKIVEGQNLIGTASAGMVEYQKSLHKGLNDTKLDGNKIDDMSMDIINDMRGGIDRLSASYTKLSANKKEAQKVDIKNGASTVATPTKEKEAKEDHKAETALKKDFEEQLAQLKLDRIIKEGKYDDLSKDKEAEFWSSKLEIAKKGGVALQSLAKEIETKIINLNGEAIKEKFTKHINALKEQADVEKADLQKKANLYAEIFNETKLHYASDTKEYLQALKNKENADLAYKNNSIEIEADFARRKALVLQSGLNIEQADIESYAQMGFITESEKIDRLKENTQKSFDIKKEALEAELKLYDKEPDKARQINSQIESLNQAHNEKIKAFARQASQSMFAPFKSMADSLQSSLANAFSGMMKGTLSFSSFIKGILPTIGQAFAQMAAQMAAKWIFEHTVMKVASIAFEAFEKTKLAAILGLSVATDTAKTTSDGVKNSAMVASATAAHLAMMPLRALEASSFMATAMIGAAASQAAIPIVGPALAAGASADMGIMLSPLVAIASARGGYDIPAGTNPITQLHEQEMVLPMEQANAVRDMAKGGASGSGANITINAVDAKSVQRLFNEHGSSLVASLKKQGRNYNV
jgi:hypothetical protein